MSIHVVALLVIIKYLKLFKCSHNRRLTEQLWYNHAVEYYAAVTKNEDPYELKQSDFHCSSPIHLEGWVAMAFQEQ